MSATQTLTWRKIRRIETTELAQRRIRESKDRRYRVVETTPLQQSSATGHGFVAMYYVWRNDLGGSWRILSWHKTEAAACAACEQHAQGS
jgi:hypothetical protein